MDCLITYRTSSGYYNSEEYYDKTNEEAYKEFKESHSDDTIVLNIIEFDEL